jgi:hypothetical protein
MSAAAKIELPDLEIPKMGEWQVKTCHSPIFG